MKKVLPVVVIVALSLLAWLSMYIFSSFEGIVFNPRGQLGALSGAGSRLVAHYTFDDTVNDSAGSNHGTIGGNPTYVSGKIGKAISMDGNDDYVNVSSNIGSATDFTITGWIKLSSGAYNQEAGNSAFWAASRQNRVLLRPVGYYIEFADGAFYQGNNNNDDSNIDKWVHIAIVKTGGNLNYYRNGALERSGAFAGQPVSLANFNWGTDGYYYFDGAMDDVRVYTRALSTSEVQSLSQSVAGSPSPTPHPSSTGSSPSVSPQVTTPTTGSFDASLAVHYTFDDTAVNARGGNSYNGTLSGNATYVPGKVGKALSINDGTGRFTTGDFISNNPGTICTWYYAKTAPWLGGIVTNGQFYLAMANENRFTVGNNGSGFYFAGAQTSPPGEWKHVCVTRESNGNSTMYLNGVAKASGNAGALTPGWGVTIGNGPTPWDGYIDDFRFYNNVLTANEVRDLYQAYRDSASLNYTLTVSKLGSSNGEITGGGISCSAPGGGACTKVIPNGTEVTLTAAPFNDAFRGWGGACRGKEQTCRFTMTSDKAVSATFNNLTTKSTIEVVNTAGEPSCELVDVERAIAQAEDEYTVILPAKTCTWNRTLVINKPIILKGQTIVETDHDNPDPNKAAIINPAAQQTIIQDGTNKALNSTQPNLIQLNSTSRGVTEITGLTIKGGVEHDGYNRGMIIVEGNNFRIHHNNFRGTNTATLRVYASGGVVDHNYFESPTIDFFVFDNHRDDPDCVVNCTRYGDYSWARPHEFGDDEAVFIEDNVFKSWGALDSWAGARSVVRFNRFIESAWSNHGTETGGRYRSALSVELYNNVFEHSYFSNAIDLRGGAALMYNNTSKGFESLVAIKNYRDHLPYDAWGQCDGTSPFDKNDGVVYDSGTHDGPPGIGTTSHLEPTRITDTSKSWRANQWVGYIGKNKRTGRAGSIMSNTSNTLIIAVDNRQGNSITNPGDGYEIRYAYPCLDQPGRSSSPLSDLINGNNPQPRKWPNQKLEPIYQWNNVTHRGPVTLGVDTTYRHLKENRDFYNNQCPDYNYKPYRYPHPFTKLPARTIDLNCPNTPPRTNYQLEVNKIGTGSGTIVGTDISCGTNCSARLVAGESVVLTANPSSGSRFVSWSGGSCSGSARTCNFTLNGNASVTANFESDGTTPPTSGDSDNDGVTSPGDKCPQTPSNLRTLVNKHGCAKPRDSKFNIKPNFQNLDLESVNNLELGISSVGKITWNGTVDVEREDTAMDLDAYIDITRGRVSLNSGALPELNKPATITLYNITVRNPAFLKDGAICTGCQLVSYSNNTLVFTVPGFSTYEVIDQGGTPPSTPSSSGGTSSRSTRSGTSSGSQVICPKGSVYSPTTGKRCTTFTNYSFKRDLTIGSKGEDVKQLQQYLNNNGFSIATSGDGSKGRETTYFGPATRNALIKFQQAKKITPASGYFGSKSRLYIQTH